MASPVNANTYFTNTPYQAQPMPNANGAYPLGASTVAPALGAAASFSPPIAAILAGSQILGSLAGGQNVSGINYQDIQKAANAIKNGYGQASKEFQGPYGIGGTQSTPGAKAKEVKQAMKPSALNAYAQEVLGMNPTEAEQWTKKQIGSDRALKDVGQNKDTSFLDFIRGGNVDGLQVSSTGNVKGIPVQPGVTGRRDPLEDMQTDLSTQIFNSASGLPGAYGQDASQGLDFRNQIRQILGSQYGINSGLDDVLNADVQNIMDISKNNMQRTMGEMMDSGFASSSLMRDALENNVYSPQRKLYTQLQGNLAGLRNQNVQNILGAANTLGGPSTFGQYMGGSLQAPSQYGGISDPQSLEAILNKQKGAANIQMGKANQLGGIYTTPYYGEEEKGVGATAKKIFDPFGVFV